MGDVKEIVILHLSDLHFYCDENSSQHDERFIALEELITLLKRIEPEWRPSVVCITGDIIYKGRQESYDKAKKWLDKLLRELNLTSEKLICCPGNHDKDCSVDSCFCDDITNNESLSEADLASEIDKKLVIPLSEELKQPFQGFSDFCRKMNMPALDLGDCDSNYLVGHRRIGFINFNVFNSAWLCKGKQDEYSKLWLGKDYYNNLKLAGKFNNKFLNRSKQEEKAFLNITLLHHPETYISPAEKRTPNPNESRIPVFYKLTSESDIILSGHTHEGVSSVLDKRHNSYIIKVGAGYSEGHHNNIKLLKVNLKRLICRSYVYYPAEQEWHEAGSISEYNFQSQRDFEDSKFIENTSIVPYSDDLIKEKNISRQSDFAGNIAFSKFPINSSNLNIPLAGYKIEYKNLKSSKGDIILVGNSGVGKSFFLYKYLIENEGCFITSFFPDRLIDELVALPQVKTLVIDNYSQKDIINRLIHYRSEAQRNLRLIVSCLPNELPQIQSILPMPSENIISLMSLNRSDIIDIIKYNKILGPDWLLSEILRQSTQLPALATFLCQEINNDKYNDFKTGNSIYKYFIAKLSTKFQCDLILILSIAAVGGEFGINIDEICKFLGISRRDILSAIERFSSCGIPYSLSSQSLAIKSRILCCGLVLNSFLTKNSTFSFEDFKIIYSLCGNKYFPFDLLLEVRRRSDLVPDYFLKEEIVKYPLNEYEDFWLRLGYTSAINAEWILCNHQSKVIGSASALLYHIPYRVIPFLLTKAVGDKRPLNSTLDHPLRIIEDWIKDNTFGDNEYINKREILLDCSLKWGQINLKHSNVVMHVISTIFSLNVSYSKQKVDDPSCYTFSFCILPYKQAKEIFNRLWPRFINYLKSEKKNTIDDYGALFNLIKMWVYPGRIVPDKKTANYKDYRRKGKQMIKDCAPFISMGGQAQLIAFANDVKIDIGIKVDKDFDRLYPKYNPLDDRDEQFLTWQENSEMVAKEWLKKTVKEVIKIVLTYESEAQKANFTWPNLMVNSLSYIARMDKVRRFDWFMELYENSISDNYLDVFLVHMHLTLSKGDLETTLFKLIESEKYGYIGLQYCLNSKNISERFFNKILPFYSKYSMVIERYSDEIPITRMRKLLECECQPVVVAAVLNEYRTTKGQIRVELYDIWENATINKLHCKDENLDYLYDLPQILSIDANLPYKWLRSHISLFGDELTMSFGELNTNYFKICEVLSDLERCDLLKIIPVKSWNYELVSAIVGNSLKAFETLLNLSYLNESLRLSPLKGCPSDEHWQGKAKLAYKSGIESSKIAKSILGNHYGWEGSESKFVQSKIDCFEELKDKFNDELHEIAIIGIEYFSERKKKAIERDTERHFDS